MFAFECGYVSKIKKKCFCKPQSKKIKFEELKNCLHGTNCQNELLIKLEINVTQQEITEVQLILNVILKSHRNKVIFYNLYMSTSLFMIFIYFLQKLVDKINKRKKFDSKSKINEENFSLRYGCARFFDSYGFSLGSLD